MSILNALKKNVPLKEVKKIYVLAFRANEITRKELKELAKALNESQNWVITNLIREAYKDLKAKGWE